MNEENKIVIVSDDNNVIHFDDITVRHDTVDRAEVAEIKNELNKLENDKIAIDDRIVELKARLLFADKVIAIADAAKAETAQEVDVPVESNDESQETEFVNEEV